MSFADSKGMNECCPEYKFCVENKFIMYDEDSAHLIIKFYAPTEKLPRSHYASVCQFCPFCGAKKIFWTREGIKL